MTSEGERLDLHLVRLGYARSRRAAAQLLAQGAVRVNGRAGRKGALIIAGDRVEVSPPDEPVGIEPSLELPLEVLFQDDAVLVINKPAPLPCHPLRADDRQTVMNAVVARFPEAGEIGDNRREGGLVHRLDNGTSGALIIARETGAFASLRLAIRNGSIARCYEALVAGQVGGALLIDTPIAHHRRNRRKMIALRDGEDSAALQARPAVTRVEPIARVGAFTLVRVTPKTGNRHQIRVHLAAARHPLVGDALYGGPRVESLSAGRFWLHLREVAFRSPVSGEITVEAPRPDDLDAALRAVRSAS